MSSVEFKFQETNDQGSTGIDVNAKLVLNKLLLESYRKLMTSGAGVKPGVRVAKTPGVADVFTQLSLPRLIR